MVNTSDLSRAPFLSQPTFIWPALCFLWKHTTGICDCTSKLLWISQHKFKMLRTSEPLLRASRHLLLGHSQPLPPHLCFWSYFIITCIGPKPQQLVSCNPINKHLAGCHRSSESPSASERCPLYASCFSLPCSQQLGFVKTRVPRKCRQLSAYTHFPC